VALPAISRPQCFGFEHRDHGEVQGKTATPPRLAIVVAQEPSDLSNRAGAISQSWNWPEAAEVVRRCRQSVLLTDLVADKLPPLERLILFQNALVALLEHYPCQAIHWLPTQQIVCPADFLAAVKESGGLVFVPGPINVRLFEIENERASDADRDILMDTLGLGALGLEDLQCHFHGLPTKEVARLLYNTAVYILERGAVIDDGHTINGIGGKEEEWPCHREPSLALPDRSVLDIHPGDAHAARERR
jgi:hypothetical protein